MTCHASITSSSTARTAHMMLQQQPLLPCTHPVSSAVLLPLLFIKSFPEGKCDRYAARRRRLAAHSNRLLYWPGCQATDLLPGTAAVC